MFIFFYFLRSPLTATLRLLAKFNLNLFIQRSFGHICYQFDVLHQRVELLKLLGIGRQLFEFDFASVLLLLLVCIHRGISKVAQQDLVQLILFVLYIIWGDV